MTRYPKCGDPNPKVRIGIADISAGNTVWADFNEDDDQYFGTPFWGADGKAFLHWDWLGHWLEYAFDVPSDGAYGLQIKYCIGGPSAFRALLVDGFLPDEAFRSMVFEETGGWSSDRNDWRWQTVSADGGKTPFRFNLTKGRHVFRFVNLENSMNMDVLKLKALP
jgi:hypothetical protein